MAPWLVEESYKYYLAACLLRHERNLLSVAEINAALSIEILLKSFLVKSAGDQGTVYERYVFDKPKKTDPHNLHDLFELLPEEIKDSIFDEETVACLKVYGDVFTKSRYKYEPTAKKSSSPILIDIAGLLLPKVVNFYKENHSVDPWINHYPNV